MDFAANRDTAQRAGADQCKSIVKQPALRPARPQGADIFSSLPKDRLQPWWWVELSGQVVEIYLKIVDKLRNMPIIQALA